MRGLRVPDDSFRHRSAVRSTALRPMRTRQFDDLGECIPDPSEPGRPRQALQNLQAARTFERQTEGLAAIRQTLGRTFQFRTVAAFRTRRPSRMTILQRIRRTLCRHDPKLVSTEITGATMPWAGGITREYQFNYRCRKCGQRSSLGGFIIPGDRRLHPEAYNARGWPIDADGNKLKIAFSKETKR